MNEKKAMQAARRRSLTFTVVRGAAAIGIAIHDACGVWLRSWPMTPEKILKALGKI